MLPFKKIMAPVDFSDHANRSLQSAIELTAHFGAKLYVVHVVSPVPMLDMMDMGEFGMGGPVGPVGAGLDVVAYQKRLVSSAEGSLRKLIEQMAPAGMNSEIVVEVGDPSSVINAAADRLQIDVIVMATHGLTGLSHLLLGSVTEKVARHARVPVLIVRQNGDGS